MTEQQFADALDVSRGTVQQWEKEGGTAPKRSRQEAVARLLGISVADLMLTHSASNVKWSLEPSQSVVEIASHGRQKDRTNELVIHQFDTGGSMGGGLVLKDQPGAITSWTVTDEWAQKNVHRVTSFANLTIVTGFGDSMKPTYNPGDPLLVDTGVKDIDHEGIFFFRVGNEGFIKRLQRIPRKGIVVISDNSKYRDWTIEPGDDFEVFGKVVKAWCGDDF